MKPFSVLLLYPDYLADGVETYWTHVEARYPAGAVAKARDEALSVNALPDDTDPMDFRVLLVLEGHHYGKDIGGL